MKHLTRFKKPAASPTAPIRLLHDFAALPLLRSSPLLWLPDRLPFAQCASKNWSQGARLCGSPPAARSCLPRTAKATKHWTGTAWNPPLFRHGSPPGSPQPGLFCPLPSSSILLLSSVPLPRTVLPKKTSSLCSRRQSASVYLAALVRYLPASAPRELSKQPKKKKEDPRKRKEHKSACTYLLQLPYFRSLETFCFAQKDQYTTAAS